MHDGAGPPTGSDHDDPVGRLAAERFGVGYLYPVQRLVMANILDAIGPGAGGLDGNEAGPARQAVLLPTGAGKSICFQLPALLADGVTVAVYPLLGLMADQARRLAERGIASVTLSGGMSSEERTRAIADLRSGRAKIALANPEILSVPAVGDALARLEVAHLAVDEAHCVSEWGDGFRPAYLALGEVAERLSPRALTAFTATASRPVLDRVARVLFKDRPYRLLMGCPDRPNIRYEAIPTLSPRRALRETVRSAEKPALVFVPSRDGAAMAAEDLRRSGTAPEAGFYHAGLSREERADREGWFLGSRDGVLCATCAYGMGMDKPDIRTVIHLGLPGSVEAYLQESGRAGRDGKPSRAVLIHGFAARASAADQGAGKRGETAKTVGPGGTPRDAPFGEARKAALESWAREPRGCRRSRLLALLGYEDAASLTCGGCDACEGRALPRPPEAGVIEAAARFHARRFDHRALARFLAGTSRGPSERAVAGLPFWGALAGWDPLEAEEAVGAALGAGLIAAGKRWPWRESVRRGPQSSGNSSSSSPAGGSSGIAAASALPARLRGMMERRLIRSAGERRADGSAT